LAHYRIREVGLKTHADVIFFDNVVLARRYIGPVGRK
jgi:hypothetical protein